MRKSRKGALYDELPLFVFSILGLIGLLVLLHFLVLGTSQGDSAQNYKKTSYSLSSQFFLKDFLNTELNQTTKQKYEAIIEKNISETIRVKDVLIEQKNVDNFLKEMRTQYLKKHSSAIKNFSNLYDLPYENMENFFTLMDVETPAQMRKNGKYPSNSDFTCGGDIENTNSQARLFCNPLHYCKNSGSHHAMMLPLQNSIDVEYRILFFNPFFSCLSGPRSDPQHLRELGVIQ